MCSLSQRQQDGDPVIRDRHSMVFVEYPGQRVHGVTWQHNWVVENGITSLLRRFFHQSHILCDGNGLPLRFCLTAGRGAVSSAGSGAKTKGPAVSPACRHPSFGICTNAKTFAAGRREILVRARLINSQTLSLRNSCCR